MMETLQSASGFTSEASLSGRPHTPPYTPARIAKRRLERSDSPASTIGSIHPAESDSPAKKTLKTSVNDDIKIEELTEGDLGYMTDLDVVYPEELEEIGSSDSETDSESASDLSDNEATQLTRKLSRLRCGDDREVEFEHIRHLRHELRRGHARHYKRTHSQSVKNEAGDTDVTLDDNDNKSVKRRLRRRTKGPIPSRLSSMTRGRVNGSPELSTGSTPGTSAYVSAAEQPVDDDMDVDAGG